MTCRNIFVAHISKSFDFGVRSTRNVIESVSHDYPDRVPQTYKSGVSALMRATTSFSTKKIQAIIDDLSAEVDKVDKLGPVVEARISRGERQNSEEERRAAGLERMENKRERKEASEFRRVVLDEQARAEKGSYWGSVFRDHILNHAFRTFLFGNQPLA